MWCSPKWWDGGGGAANETAVVPKMYKTCSFILFGCPPVFPTFLTLCNFPHRVGTSFYFSIRCMWSLVELIPSVVWEPHLWLWTQAWSIRNHIPLWQQWSQNIPKCSLEWLGENYALVIKMMEAKKQGRGVSLLSKNMLEVNNTGSRKQNREQSIPLLMLFYIRMHFCLTLPTLAFATVWTNKVARG